MAHANTIQITETGRQLGHDLFRYQRTTMHQRLPPALREGFKCAAATGARARPADRYVRKWLQLRLGAWERGRVFDEGVTPALLKQIDVRICPILRTPLTHGTGLDTDWSVDRLNNEGAYAPNNLAIMSARANRAKGVLTFEQVLARSELVGSSEGLQPAEWLRLASLMLGPSFASRPSEAPCLPLVAPIPRYAVCSTTQHIQHVFTICAASQAGKNRLIKQFRVSASGELSESRLRQFAEAIHVGLKSVDFANDVWLQARAMDALRRWREALRDHEWGRVGEISRAVAGSRVVPPSRLKSWSLELRGRIGKTVLNRRTP